MPVGQHRRIHLLWFGPAEPPAAWMATWRDHHRDWEYRIWNEDAVRELEFANKPLFERMLRRKLWDGAADVARIEILRQFGGVYVDADSECLHSMDGESFLNADFFAVIEETTSFVGTLISNAFMGSVPNHPVLLRYGEELSNLQKFTPTWQCSGPVMLTRILQDRPEGVELLPAATFYDRSLQGVPIHGRHIARHMWGTTNLLHLEEPFSILVAFREDSQGKRTRLWNFIRERLERDFPNAEICVGTDDSMPFNKSRALNRAAADSTHDVLAIFDSDTWVLPDDVREAIKLVRGGAPWVRPWQWKVSLTEEITERVLDQGLDWDGTLPRGKVEGRTNWWSSPPVVLSRAAFDAVNGLDQRFQGWGQEDDAFGHALQVIVGKRVEVGTMDAVHLWHPRIGKHGHDAWEGSRFGQNVEMGRTYRSAKRTAMQQLVAGNRDGHPAILPPKVSVLVPFRSESLGGPRERAWAWLQQRWSWLLPGVELVEGHDDGGEPFSKTTAVNDAFMRCTGDVLIVADADSWMETNRLERAIAIATSKERLVVPWGEVLKLRQSDTEAMLACDPRSPVFLKGLRHDDPSPRPLTAGVIFVITRSAFEAVNGMDPRFRGWGHEDISFRRACDVLLGGTMYLQMGIAYSLWHPRPTAEKRGRIWGEHDAGRMNGDLANLYSHLERYQHPRQMKALCDQHPLGGEASPIVPRERGHGDVTVHETVYG